MKKHPQNDTRVQDISTENLLSLVDVSPPIPKKELVLGTLVKLLDGSGYGVTFHGRNTPIPCLSTVSLDDSCLQRQVALMFVEGSPTQPVILGFIQQPVPTIPIEARVDQKRLQLVGHEEIELRCGKASILMKANGKIIIKGTHLISRSSGPNKIKGGSISLN